MIWADADIRLIVKTTVQSVIWADTDIRFIVKVTTQNVILADTDLRLTVKTTAQSVINCVIFRHEDGHEYAIILTLLHRVIKSVKY